jgi:CheY-like chemotaxis protein
VGSTFVLTLPLEATARPAPVAEPAPEPVELACADEARPLRVLLADDHPVNRKVVELILGGAGVELTSVEDGRQACEAFAAGNYDLVFMDMQMPVMDGLTAVRLIRAREAVDGARTPILMLTANALPEHVSAAELAGADGHLAKPIAAAALLGVVERVRSGSPERMTRAA